MRYVNWSVAILVVGICGMSQTLAAEEIWGNWTAVGNGCAPNTLQVVKGGDALAISFDDLAINLATNLVGGNRNQIFFAAKACHFRIQFTPPAGKYLAGFKQLYNGGLIKSARTWARLDITYRVNHLVKYKAVKWQAGRAIGPEQPASVLAVTYADAVGAQRCREAGIYAVSLVLTGALPGGRQRPGEFVIGGLETLDATLNTSGAPSVCMVPQWAACR